MCSVTKCGAGAVCLAKSHIGQCQCPSGLLAGDPTTEGCSSVGCLVNEDCPGDKACNRMDFKCMDVCYDACGQNAVCIPDNKHNYDCKCAAGYEPNPSAEILCTRASVCESNPCHTTAQCVPNGATYLCSCPPNEIGDVYTTGCRPEGTCPRGNDDCPIESICRRGVCKSPCERYCVAYAVCNVVNRRPQCNCPQGFEKVPRSRRGRIRAIEKCTQSTGCLEGTCPLGDNAAYK